MASADTSTQELRRWAVERAMNMAFAKDATALDATKIVTDAKTFENYVKSQ